MFYFLTLLCATLRIITFVFIIPASQELNLTLAILPSVVKICIGIIEVEVMIEIAIRVKENTKTYVLENSTRRGQTDQNTMNDIIAAKNMTKLKIRLC